VFTLASRGKDGATMRSHLEVAARRGNASARTELVAPPFPRRYAYLVEWFFELHHARGAGMNGPAALTWVDFDAWARCTARTPSPWEFSVLRSLDGAFFASIEATQ